MLCIISINSYPSKYRSNLKIRIYLSSVSKALHLNLQYHIRSEVKVHCIYLQNVFFTIFPHSSEYLKSMNCTLFLSVRRNLYATVSKRLIKIFILMLHESSHLAEFLAFCASNCIFVIRPVVSFFSPLLSA